MSKLYRQIKRLFRRKSKVEPLRGPSSALHGGNRGRIDIGNLIWKVKPYRNNEIWKKLFPRRPKPSRLTRLRWWLKKKYYA